MGTVGVGELADDLVEDDLIGRGDRVQVEGLVATELRNVVGGQACRGGALLPLGEGWGVVGGLGLAAQHHEVAALLVGGAAAVAGGEGGNGRLDLLGAGGEGALDLRAHAGDLEVAPLAVDAVAETHQFGGQFGAVHGAGFGGHAVQLAGVDGRPAALPAGPAPGAGPGIVGAQRQVGDGAVVVQLGVGGVALLVLLGAEAGRVVAEAGDGQAGAALVADLTADAAADQGGGRFDVIEAEPATC
jgi:hypothetical protein